MDRLGFSRALAKSGKKEHVIAELVNQVQLFENFLTNKQSVSLENASALDILEYAESMNLAASKNNLRAIALYYHFLGNIPLAQTASRLREQRIAGTRKAPNLGEFRGGDPEAINRLKMYGIRDAEQMLQAGSNPAHRKKLSTGLGIEEEDILELVKLSDLARIPGVKGIRARLYYDAGIDTLDKLAGWEPEALRLYLVEFIEKTGFEGAAPLPKEVVNTVNDAKRLPRLVEY